MNGLQINLVQVNAMGRCTNLVKEAVQALEKNVGRAKKLYLLFLADPANKGCSCYVHAARDLGFTNINFVPTRTTSNFALMKMTGGKPKELGVKCTEFPAGGDNKFKMHWTFLGRGR